MAEQTPDSGEGTEDRPAPDQTGDQGGVENGGEGILELAPSFFGSPGKEGEDPEREGSDPAPDDRAAKEDDVAEGPLPPLKAGPKVPKSGDVQRRKPRIITAQDCGRALGHAKGDFKLAAAALGISENALRLRVSKNAQLRALYQVGDVSPPHQGIVYEREQPPLTTLTALESEHLLRTNQQIMRNGLAAAGISAETVDKLKLFENFAPNSGEYLVAALDISHRMMLFQNVSLFERAEWIKKNILDRAGIPGTEDEAFSPLVLIEWQRVYNEICELIGKGYDRTLNGTQALAKIVGDGGEKSKGKKKKFGFSPSGGNDAG